MSHFAGQLHRSAIFSTSSSIAVPRTLCLTARQSYKGQISTLHITQLGDVACSASAALTEEALSNGAGVQQMRGPAQEACAAGHLSEDGTAFLEEHRIRGYEVGPDQQTTIVTMANLLQVPRPHRRKFSCHSSCSLCKCTWHTLISVPFLRTFIQFYHVAFRKLLAIMQCPCGAGLMQDMQQIPSWSRGT